MRRIALAMSLVLAGTMAQAGSAIYVPPVPTDVETPQMRNGSGAWLIPLAIIAILALTLTGEDDGNEGNASDARLKMDIRAAGMADNGLPLYTFRYIGGSHTYLGVMAQDVLTHTPEAVVAGPFGFMAVDYGMLGLEMQMID